MRVVEKRKKGGRERGNGRDAHRIERRGKMMPGTALGHRVESYRLDVASQRDERSVDGRTEVPAAGRDPGPGSGNGPG